MSKLPYNNDHDTTSPSQFSSNLPPLPYTQQIEPRTSGSSCPINRPPNAYSHLQYGGSTSSGQPSHQLNQPAVHSKEGSYSSSGQVNYPPQQAVVNVSSTGMSSAQARSVQSSGSQTPACFSRPPQIQGYALAPFPSFRVPCNGRTFQDGFPQFYPQPQHLSARDIHEADWLQFMQELSDEGRLKGGQKVTASILPIAMHVGATGFLITRAIEKRMKKGNVGKAAAKIDIWNYCFFNARGVNISLFQGPRRVSGPSTGSSSSSSSSSEDEDRHPAMGMSRESRRAAKEARREDRRRRREQRRHDKQKRRELKRGEKTDEPYYLLVESQHL
ncbi:hypothetical protein K493DRAFT_321960 [Basidiobolus meristosporus CBS 931.73]|uniref:Uncharacterized protein n=1 Tax=Basidiobolus meristosporus CBS 931.73 TaxID=1314790 RepID=A0A1Y1VUH8_9FUNG|nr:hypothetical protein K493DRAFT_321960 [Basidiobolus meristosporus CBS 931.73]|eukprot:ORX64666.1 hypothetical protein K493DRAFT_321960 [Basidiobolus meristosporus CBS 931.73]